jgi:hypothetical protein
LLHGKLFFCFCFVFFLPFFEKCPSLCSIESGTALWILKQARFHAPEEQNAHRETTKKKKKKKEKKKKEKE